MVSTTEQRDARRTALVTAERHLRTSTLDEPLRTETLVQALGLGSRRSSGRRWMHRVLASWVAAGLAERVGHGAYVKTVGP